MSGGGSTIAQSRPGGAVGAEAGELIGPPKWQRRWSKALVRHGAEAQAAIVGVSGLPAGDIQLREGSG